MFLLDDNEPFQTKLEDLRLMFLKRAEVVDVGEWHSQPIDNPLLVTRELQNTVIVLRPPARVEDLQAEVRPNLPWAEDHFQERVCGKPLNPPPSNEWWPFAQAGNEKHKTGSYFSHTYPERMWPRHAGDGMRLMTDEPDWDAITRNREAAGKVNRGIRYDYGDLAGVVEQLRDNPDTRQAYLPIWFPEDTGVHHGERVPCTLGYHFLIRRGLLYCNYYIRSCDFVRHFKDDVYMAGRLMQWMVGQLSPEPVKLGDMTMFISSFHIFEGDVPKLKGLV
jgi:hypothetical protein